MKYLFSLLSFLYSASVYASLDESIIPDYNPLATHKPAPVMPSSAEIGKEVLDLLNQNPSSREHLNRYLDEHGDPGHLHRIFHAGVALMNLTEPVEGAPYKKTSRRILDIRALELLHFVYQKDPRIDIWLPYYYALALIHFRQNAKDWFEMEQPIQEAFNAYDRWIRLIKAEFEHHELLEDNPQLWRDQPHDMPMVRINPKKQPHIIDMEELERKNLSYELAHKDFYALLSLTVATAKEDEQALLFKGVQRYNIGSSTYDDEDKPKEVSQKKKTSLWLNHLVETLAGLGFAMVPVVILSSYTSDSFNGK